MSEVKTTEPSPVIMIAAFTEALKSVLGEIRSLAVEAFKFQLQMMELLPAEQRIEAFRLVLDANTACIMSDERVALALLSTVETLGTAAAQVLPAAFTMRRDEIAARVTQMENDARAAADRRTVEGMKKTVQ